MKRFVSVKIYVLTKVYTESVKGTGTGWDSGME